MRMMLWKSSAVPGLDYDDCSSYADGAIPSANGGSGWGAAGTFLELIYPKDYDDCSSYSTGVLPSANGGSGWAANGTFLTLV